MQFPRMTSSVCLAILVVALNPANPNKKVATVIRAVVIINVNDKSSAILINANRIIK